MVEYIYFVQLTNGEEEAFDFLVDAKAYAMSNIDKKPCITQTEVIRNDFGECVESKNLGTIWSWTELMQDIPEDDEVIFNKEGTFGIPEIDKEFSDDDIVFETDCVTDKPNLTYFGESLEVGDEVFCKVNKKSGTVKGIKGDTVTVEFTGGEEPDRIDTYYKTDLLPTLRTMVEEMEENEDMVECTWCSELVDKSECRYEVKMGWLCEYCIEALESRGEVLTFREGYFDESLKEAADEMVVCSKCNETFPKSDCFNEKTKGYLCPICIMDLDAAGEDMEFIREPIVTEAFDTKETVEFVYDNLTINVQSPQYDVDDWEDIEYADVYTYEVPKEEVATDLWDNFLEKEDVADVVGGFSTLEDDTAWEKFLDTHFDSLFEKYYDKLLKHYEDEARKAFESEFGWDEYQELKKSRNESVEKKSMLEELEDAEEYNKRLTMCPECGETSFDAETGFCISCGFN